MASDSKNQLPELSATQQADYDAQYGADPEQADRAEYGLLINGIPFDLLFDYCVKHDLATNGDIYKTVFNHLKTNKKEEITK